MQLPLEDYFDSFHKDPLTTSEDGLKQLAQGLQYIHAQNVNSSYRP